MNQRNTPNTRNRVEVHQDGRACYTTYLVVYIMPSCKFLNGLSPFSSLPGDTTKKTFCLSIAMSGARAQLTGIGCSECALRPKHATLSFTIMLTPERHSLRCFRAIHEKILHGGFHQAYTSSSSVQMSGFSGEPVLFRLAPKVSAMFIIRSAFSRVFVAYSFKEVHTAHTSTSVQLFREFLLRIASRR